MNQNLSPLKIALSEKTPLISVIIPLFNKSQFLEETINGIAAQNYENLEVLIRDDGSTDSSFSIAQELSKKLPQLSIKVFDGTNLGPGACRNYLIQRTSSPIVVLMDADDLMLPGFLHAAIDAMRKQSARVVYSDVLLTGAHASEWCPPPFDQFGIRYANCLTSLCMIDRDLWREANGYNEGMPFNEDWEFFIRTAQLSKAFHKLPGKYFTYRQTEQGLYHSFILDNWSHNLSHVICANPSLYQVDEVLHAINSLKAMPPTWIEKFNHCIIRNPQSSLPYTMLAIAETVKNNTSQAITLYEKAISLDTPNSWLNHFLLAKHLENINPSQAAMLFHHVRTKRPDMGRYVNHSISEITNRLTQQTSSLFT
jgi:glycosyltransferase involved in cell wall biosynthesis